MAKNAHLTYDERLTIQSSLADRLSFKAIGLILGKDPSTIAKEVKGHLKIEDVVVTSVVVLTILYFRVTIYCLF